MPRPVSRLVFGCIAFLATLTPHLRGVTATIDLGTTHQVIRGFGGATVYRPTEPLADTDLDLLFGTDPGQIGFSLLRIRVATDPAWRELELANARGARARGAKVIATPWSPPAEWKSNQDLVGGRLLPEHYGAYAAYLDDFAAWMEDHDAPLYAISVQNEPDIEVTYESCDWTPEEMLAFCRDHAGVIDTTRLIAPESFQFRRNLSDPLLADPAALANVDIIGGHIYGGGLADYPAARAAGKEVWMTEYLDLLYDWPNALKTAREIHQCLVDANFSAYLWWYLKRYYGPLGEDSVVTRRGYVMSQFARFIRPGYVRVEATATPATNVYVSAFKHDRLVIVAVNTGATAIAQSFALTPGAVATVTPWTTTATLSAEEGSAITVAHGTFTATLPASSVTTFVGDLVLPPPTLVREPRGHILAYGASVVFEVEAVGEALSYQWFHDGTPLPGATADRLVLSSPPLTANGDYTVRVSNSGGSVTSAPATLLQVPGVIPGHLVNLSTRATTGVDGELLTGGFVITGFEPKTVLVRAAGPVLRDDFGLTAALAEPRLVVHNQQTREIIATGTGWDAALADTFAELGAFAWPAGSRDAALQLTLAPGVYTAQIASATSGDADGIALLEIYDAHPAEISPQLSNLSTRSLVRTDNEAQIGGFVIGGNTSLTVLLRAAGPALLTRFGLAEAISDPVIELYDQITGERLASSSAWDLDLRPIFTQTGAFPWSPESKDAALLLSLPPGPYSLVVRNRSGAPGLALLEVYTLPP